MNPPRRSHFETLDRRTGVLSQAACQKK